MATDQSDYESEMGVISDADQYLTFILADEEYGIDIRRVQEVRGWEAVNQMPNAPSFIKGVINLRGAIVPIIDLRERFRQQTVAYGPKTVVIVIKMAGGTNTTTMGIVVDAVSNVYNITATQMRPPPDFCTVIHADFVKGLATVNEKMIILLDTDGLLQMDELKQIKSLKSAAA